jgi:tRNA 2-thiouridine synthesizing protein A
MVRRRLLDLSINNSTLREVSLSESAASAADRVLDCAGMSCPLPVLKTAQAIKDLAPGQVLELLATDPGVEPDMRAWTRRTGNELLSVSKTDEVFHVLIRRVK